MDKIIKSVLTSIIFCLFFNVPVTFYKTMFIGKWDIIFIVEIILVILLTYLLFFLIYSIKYLNHILVTLLFAIGGASNYFILTHRKIFDAGVMIDFLSVEFNLIREYLDIKLLLCVLTFGLIGYYLSVSKILVRPKLYQPLVACNIVAILFVIYGVINNKHVNPQKLIVSYLPYNVFYNTYHFLHHYLPHVQKMNNKIDLTQQHKLSLNTNSSKPLLVALIIGESMRGDLISLNGYEVNNTPLLSQIPQIVSFTNAISSSTATRISLPYMLTRAVPPNFDQALNELSIISLFKSLGFTTSWIGNQGAFGAYETTYASIAMEADFVLFQPQIKKIYSTHQVYDEYLLNLISDRINKVQNNHFMVVHMYGSHWSFKSRYPSNFVERFLPTCTKNSPAECSYQELSNGYHNTITYSDYVLSEIINIFKSHNSFMLYASDHGFSLGENGLYGNAHLEDPTPKEQLNIAMFSWGSDSFLQKYNDNYNRLLQKKSLAVSHNNIFHSLLGCINVNSQLINSNLNLCH